MRDCQTFSGTLLTNGTFVFAFEPFVNTFAVESMLALFELLHLVAVLENVHADGAGGFRLCRVVFKSPSYLWDLSNFSC